MKISKDRDKVNMPIISYVSTGIVIYANPTSFLSSFCKVFVILSLVDWPFFPFPQ